MSLSGVVTLKGKEVHRVVLDLENQEGDNLVNLVTQLRALQEDTNKFLTGLIHAEGNNGNVVDDSQEEEDDASESDGEGPEPKQPKLSN